MKDLIETEASRDTSLADLAAGATPLEPRILLDAVLDLDPGLAGGDALYAIAGALTAHTDELDRIEAGIERVFGDSFGGAAGAYDGDTGTGLGDDGAEDTVADIVFEGVRTAIDASLAAFEAQLQDFAATEGQALLDAVNASLQSRIGTVPTAIGSVAEMQGFLTADLLADEGAFDAQAAALGGSDAAGNGDFLLQGVLDHAAARGVDLFTIDLTDQVVNGASVTFTQDGAGVSVRAEAPDLSFEVNPTFANSGLATVDGAPDTVDADLRDFAFGFDLAVDASAAELRITADNFTLPGFELGEGVVFSEDNGFSTVEVEASSFRFTATGFGDLSVTGLHDNALGLSAGASTEASLSFTTEIRGPNDGDVFGVVDVGFNQIILQSVFDTIVTAPAVTDANVVVQSSAVTPFTTGSQGGSGSGFDGTGSGDAETNINDANLILDGLEAILGEADEAIEAVLSATALPIIGRNLGVGFTLFDDLRFDLIPEASARADTGSNGQPVTTVDLLTGFLNDEINALLGASGQQFVTATLGGFGSAQSNFLVGNLGFSTEVFSAAIAAPFEFGADLPGFDFQFENGSDLTLTVFADLNIGFGVDANGFFLLNDTNEAEISLDFVVDAGDFEGQFNVAGLLDFSAVAVADPTQLDLFTFAQAPAEGQRGDLSVSASLDADLYGSLGTTLAGAVKNALNPFDIQKGDGTNIVFEKSLRFAELDRAQELGQSIAEIGITADADINLQLTAEVLDPTTGQPIQINGVSAVPTVITELVIDASLGLGDGQVKIDTLLLNDLRLDARPIFEGYLEPLFDPLQPFVEPIQTLHGFLNTAPVSFVLPALAAAVPAVGLAVDIATIANRVATMVEGLEATGGFVLFGDQFFDETGAPIGIGETAFVDGQATVAGNINSSNLDENKRGQTLDQFLASQGLAVAPTNSVSIDLPILTDVSNVLALMRGDFDQVTLVTATYTGVNFGVDSASIIDEVQDIIDSVGVPSEIVDFILDDVFPISVSANAFFGFTAGYDLSGVQGFIQTLDVDRLLDGIFIDVAEASASTEQVEIFPGVFQTTISPGILDIGVDFDADLSFGGTFLGTGIEVGISAFGSGSATVLLTDPNRDGKLRLNEIAAILADINPSSFTSYATAFFDGSLDIDLGFEIFGEVEVLGVGEGFSEDFFTVDLDLDLDGGGIGEAVLTESLGGGTVILNVGTKAGDSFFVPNLRENNGTAEFVQLDGSGGGVNFTWVRVENGSGGFVTSTPFVGNSFGASAVILPMGDGTNNVQMGDLSGVDTLTFLGDGNEGNNQVNLAEDGFHVIFGGDTGNLITAEDGVTGTYWLFGGEGADDFQVNGGNVIAFGEDIFGMRDAFLAAFADGGFSQAAAEQVFANHLASKGIGEGFSAENPDFFQDALTALEQVYTVETQLLASRTGDSFDLGDDNSTINRVFASGGDDFVLIAGGRDAQVMLGAGDDEANIRTDRSSLVEGGAGSDRMTGGDAADRMFGYAAALGNDGTTEDRALNALANQDGDDVILAGGGNDSLFGQRGNNLIEGSGGDDSIIGGRGDDIVFGGKLNTTLGSGTVLDFGEISLEALRGETFSALVFEDGDDKIGGGAGDDVVIGGAGADTVIATAGRNVLIGDFADIAFVTAGQITSVVSTEIGSDLNGRDVIEGGTGFDLMIGGGGTEATGFFDGDRLDDSSGGNIFIGDDAEVTGPNVLGNATLITALLGAGADSGDILETSFSGANNIMVGGEGGDLINGDGGGNIMVGDLAVIDLTAGTVTSIETDSAGDDTLQIRNSEQRGDLGAVNLMIGGGGADFIRGSVFADHVLGDSGTITFDVDLRAQMNAFSFVNRVAANGSDPVATPEEIAAEDAALLAFAGVVIRMESAGLASDGDDSFDLDAGGDRFIGGGGSDGAFATDGVTILHQNGTGGLAGIFVLDSGEIDLIAGTASVVSNEFSGDDVIRAGAGNHLILAGDGSDLIELGRTEVSFGAIVDGQSVIVTRATTPEEAAALGGDGDHAILGDSGTITFDAATLAVQTMNSVASARDGADTVRPFQNSLAESPVGGQGDNLVILGGGADALQLGNGDNRVLGDGGRIDLLTGTLTSAAVLPDPAPAEDTESFAGDDVLRLGTGFNRVIAGGGSDQVLTAGLGADASAADASAAGGNSQVIVADAGEISFDAATGAVTRAASIGQDFDGDDLVIAGAGNHRIILGGNLDILQDAGEVIQGKDTAILGKGSAFVVGDTGIINLAVGAMLGESNDRTGVDFITTGEGKGFIIGGSEFDTLDLGLIFDEAGVASAFRSTETQAVLGDNGLINFDVATLAVTSMSSEFTADDRSDNIKVGGGDNFAILGGGSDLYQTDTSIADGRNVVVGDAGSIDLTGGTTPGFAQVRSDSTGGDNNDDTIRLGRGGNVVIGGVGGDSITASGDNAILGDQGRVSFAIATGDVASMQGNATGSDGNDVIELGFGRSNVIMGGGSDTLTEGGSSNSDRIVIGDGGAISLVNGTVEATGSDEDGADRITVTRSVSLLIGGGAGDTFLTGRDAALILGDTGTATFSTADDGTRTFLTLASTLTAADGDDTVTQRLFSDEGAEITAVLGGGSDTFTASTGAQTVIGDGGSADLVAGTLTAFADAGGADSITAGSGDAIVLAGAGDDVVDLGGGANALIGDAGQVLLDGGELDRIIAANDATDGADTVTAGDGNNRIVLGGGADSLTAGDGINIVIGDGGEIRSNAAFTTGLDIGDAVGGGDDRMSLGSGANIVIGGQGADVIEAGVAAAPAGNVEPGDNAIIATLGRIDFVAATLAARTLTSVSDSRDGNDRVTTGAGGDLVILGAGTDTVTAGEGDNIILGDDGAITLATGTVISGDGGTGGADRITAGSGDNIVLGGAAGDRMTLGDGANAVLGDFGTVTFGVQGAETLESSITGAGGADSLTAGDGGNNVILGEGADIAALGNGGGAVLGDDGRIDLVTGTMTGGSDATAAGDTITATGGDNLVIAGAGADSVSLGGGADAIVGDTGTVTFDAATRAALTLTSGHDARDGGDLIDGGAGDNSAVLGGGADSASFGAGRDVVVADGGTIDLVTGRAETGTDPGTEALAGADTVTGGDGANILIGGAQGDSLTGGADGDAVLGDGGSITFDAATRAARVLTSEFDALDGVDVIAVAGGDNRVIAGGAADTVTAADGADAILGDAGTIDLTTGSARTGSDALAGADSISAGGGTDILLGGSFADRIDATGGDNLILGDTGEITFNPATLAALVLTSEFDALDGADSVTAGGGDNAVILGGADDAALLGDGENIVLGDAGTVDLVTGSASTGTDALAGADTVTAGSGDNIVLGGSFADRIVVTGGNNLILGDTGQVTFTPATRAGLVLTSEFDARDGADSVTAGDGDNDVILGGAADRVLLGDGGNRVLGDAGTIDRVADVARTASNALAGADTITAGSGDNTILGGSFADVIGVTGGDNQILGDTGSIGIDSVTGLTVMTSEFDALDGADSVTAGDGDNEVILGGEADRVLLGDGDNVVLGDAGTIDFAGSARTASNALAGADTITAGSGANTILGGSFADRIDVAGGNNKIIADTGDITADLVALELVMTSGFDVRDGADSVTAGGGNNVIILGGADDAALVGDGVNLVLGDAGTANLTTGVAETGSDALAGADTITAGAGDNLILGGSFADRIDVGLGDNAIIADTGTLTFDANTGAALTLVSAHDARDGADSVTATGGDNAVILGGADDAALFGDGDNVVLGDAGTIDLVTGRAEDVSDALSGSDTITAGNGANRIVAGAFGDRIDLGGGDNAVLADTGRIDFAADARGGAAGLTIASRFDARDGADSVTAGAGDNRVVLGGASDQALFGDGDNIVIGDSGSVTEAAIDGARTATTADEGTGAGDTITLGNGGDAVLAGDGSDLVTATGGDNVIAGDGGTMRFTSGVPLNDLLSFEVRAAAIGAADTVRTAGGDDIVIGAVGNDTIETAGGDDIAAGDWVAITTPGTAFGVIASTDFAIEGDDLIETGSGRDIAIGGSGADTLLVGEGEDTGIGDNARVEYSRTTNVEAILLTDLARGGNDTLTATGPGDNLLIGAAGDDTLTGGDTEDVLVGDLATFGFLPTGVFGLGETHVDRLVEIDAIEPGIAGTDVLDGGEGRDLLLAGFGADTLLGGDGQDILAGDSFSIRVTFTPDVPAGLLIETLTFESNFAFLTGGFDFLDGEDGPDIVIGDLGPDGINGNTATDFLAGDAVAFTLTAPFASLADLPPGAPGGQFGADRRFELITVNFAGPGANDLVSSSQVGSSIGVKLDRVSGANDEATGIAAIQSLVASGASGVELVQLLSDRAAELFDAVSQSLTSAAAVQQIAELLAMDVPADVLVEMLQNGLAASLVASLGEELTPLDRYIVIRLLEEIVKPALEAAETQQEAA